MNSAKWLFAFTCKNSIWTHKPWPASHGFPTQGFRLKWTLSQSDVNAINTIDKEDFFIRPPKQSMFGHKSRNHPRALEIERICDHWLIKHFSWLFKNEQDMEKLLRNRLTGFMTNSAPDADTDLLILSSDICNYSFIMDDFLFDSIHADLKRSEAILGEFTQMLSNPTSTRPPTTNWTAIFRQNLLPRMYQLWPRKYIRDFYVEWNKYIWISLQQAHVVRRGWVDTDWDQFLIDRFYNQGIGYAMSIYQPCFGVDILAGEVMNEKCLKLVQLNCQFISFGNDLHSFKKEVLTENIITNPVWVYKMFNGVSWQQAINDVRNMAERCLIDATKLIEEIRRESDDPKVLEWLDQVVPIFRWMHNGFIEWAANHSERYKGDMHHFTLTNLKPQLYQFAQNSQPTQQFGTSEEEDSFLANVKHGNVC